MNLKLDVSSLQRKVDARSCPHVMARVWHEISRLPARRYERRPLVRVITTLSTSCGVRYSLKSPATAEQLPRLLQSTK